MNTRLIPIAALLTLTAPAHAEDASHINRVDPITILRAIALMEIDPGKVELRPAQGLILQYANSSTNITVTMDPGFFPWMSRNPKPRNAHILLAAYVAGNIRPQIENQTNRNHPIEGMLFMCNAYKQLRKRLQVDRIPELERWKKMDRKGAITLIPYIRTID